MGPHFNLENVRVCVCRIKAELAQIRGGCYFCEGKEGRDLNLLGWIILN